MADVSFRKLTTGEWGIWSNEQLTPGETVRVERKDGEVQEVRVGRVVGEKPPDWFLYRIRRDEAPKPATPAQPPADVKSWAHPPPPIPEAPEEAPSPPQEPKSAATYITLVANAADGLQSDKELVPGATVEVGDAAGNRRKAVVGELRATDKEGSWIYGIAAWAEEGTQEVAGAPPPAAPDVKAAPVQTEKQEAEKKPTEPPGKITFVFRAPGRFDLSSPVELAPGEVVEAHRRNGETDQVVVGEPRGRGDDGSFRYAIVRDEQKPTPPKAEAKKAERKPAKPRPTDDPFKEVYGPRKVGK